MKEQIISQEESLNFADFAISKDILEVMERNGFIKPTIIQRKVIPVGLEGKDVVGIAQTGTGKTLGFGIPMLERIRGNKGRGLVILPTRELALQVNETLMKIGGELGLKTAVLIGGDSMGRQLRDLSRGPNIIVATPGRLIDHIKKGLRLDSISILVLDEADHMFDIGFAPQIKEIMKKIPKERQTMLFSATMPDEIAKLAMENMKLPLRIEVAPAGSTSKNIEQEIIIVRKNDKFDLLMELLKETEGSVLVFSRTKHNAGSLTKELIKNEISAAEIHSDRSLSQRRQALDGFKNGKYRVLIATDIAARGIDVKNIALVINYDLPDQKEDYVHRIGRTGRGESTGKAISFATPDQKYEIFTIEKLIKKTIPKKSHKGASVDLGGGHGHGKIHGGRGGVKRGFSKNRTRNSGFRGGFSGGRNYSGRSFSNRTNSNKTSTSNKGSINRGFSRNKPR